MPVVDTEDVVKKALEELRNNQLIPDYEKHEEKIMEVLKETAQVEATLTTKMFHMIDNKNMREVEQAISAIIGYERVDFIKKYFAMETYKMKVVEKPDGQSAVQVYRNGIEFQPERMLMTINDIDAVTVLQWASLALEITHLVLSCVGLGLDISEIVIRAVVKEVEALVREPAFQRAVEKFVEAWNAAGGNAWAKAKAIFEFLKDTYSLGIFWKIIFLYFQKMSAWEDIKAIAEVALMIIVGFATDGLALISEIVLIVDIAIDLADNIANLVMFSDMMKTMK
jgi:hypothetical protein